MFANSKLISSWVPGGNTGEIKLARKDTAYYTLHAGGLG